MSAGVIGAILGFISTLGFATQQITNRRLVYQANVYRTTFLTLVGAVLASILAAPLLIQPFNQSGALGLALVWFALSGIFHFSIGWTLQGFSQRILGAARASPLTSSMVVLGAIFGALFLGEPFNLILIVGIALTMLGVYLIAREGMNGANGDAHSWKGIFLGLAAGTCWSISPILFRYGYALVPSTFIAVFTGLCAGMAIAGAIWLVNRRRTPDMPNADPTLAAPPRTFWYLQALAGITVGIAVWTRWASLTFLPVVTVNALNMFTIPIVVIAAPIVLGKRLERTGWKLWLGTVSMLIGVAMTLVGGM